MKLYGTKVRDGKTTHYYLPPQLSHPVGSHLVRPYRIFDDMGYRWSINLIFGVERSVVHISELETAVISSLGYPTAVYAARPATRSDGKTCGCLECVKKRAAVIDGWRPPGYENIKWKLEEHNGTHGAI